MHKLLCIKTVPKVFATDHRVYLSSDWQVLPDGEEVPISNCGANRESATQIPQQLTLVRLIIYIGVPKVNIEM